MIYLYLDRYSQRTANAKRRLPEQTLLLRLRTIPMTKHNQLKRSNVTQRAHDLLTNIHSIPGHFFQELAVGQSVLVAAIYSLLRSAQENSCVLQLRTVWNRFEREGGSLLENLRRRMTT